MYFTGIIIAVCTFLIIGMCHPLVIHHRTGMYRASSFCGERDSVITAWCDRGIVPVGHRRTVLAEEACGERMVPDEPEAQRRVYLASLGVKSEK